MDNILFLTELLGLHVYDLRGRKIGRVRDAALVPAVDPARVDRFLIGGGWAWLTVRYDQVRSVGLDGLVLRDEQLTPYHNDESMLRLVRDLLDQQIIDAQGRKVVRVSDLTFAISRANGHEELRVVDVDIGLRSVFRRVAQGVIPPRWIRSVQRPIPPRSIPWQACNIIESDPQRRLHLNISYEYLEDMHPADIADIVEDLGPDDRQAIIATIDEEVAADALSEVEPEVQAGIVEALDPEKAADIVEEMEPDQAADLLGELEEKAATEILAEMEPESKSEVGELLEYPADQAGGLMTTDWCALPATLTVEQALARLREMPEQDDILNTVFLEDTERRLIGAVPLARLLTGTPSTPLRTLASETMPRVAIDERQARVIELFDKYNLLALPVVDADRRLAGIITADDIIAVLRERRSR